MELLDKVREFENVQSRLQEQQEQEKFRQTRRMREIKEMDDPQYQRLSQSVFDQQIDNHRKNIHLLLLSRQNDEKLLCAEKA